jgi:hypothetical protein
VGAGADIDPKVHPIQERAISAIGIDVPARCVNGTRTKGIETGAISLSRALARLSSSFTPEDDRYVNDRNRRQHHEHDDKADRRIDQVRPDRASRANDQTKHGKP